MFDVCIVGAGLWGSAAARHASSVTGVKACLIGPDEPQTRLSSDSRDIFGAHYDEGRMATGMCDHFVWGKLTQRSVRWYRELERLSGIRFFEEVGCLIAGDKDSEIIKSFKHNAREQELHLTHFQDITEINDKFPYLVFNANDEALFEERNAGYISPRKMIEAQQLVARNNGCHIVCDVVSDVIRQTDSNGDYFMDVCLESGDRYRAEKVLITTGGFVNMRNLLGSTIKCDVKLLPASVAKVEISEEDAVKISEMPPICYYGKGDPSWCKEFPRTADGDACFYMLPPIKYSDGKYYLKLGHESPPNRQAFTKGQEVKEWYCKEGDDELIKAAAKLILCVVKGVKMVSYHGDRCVITETPTKSPYIDMVHPQLGLAVGGNGSGAQCSDEIGRIAAMMVVKGSWETYLPKDIFKLQFKVPDNE